MCSRRPRRPAGCAAFYPQRSCHVLGGGCPIPIPAIGFLARSIAEAEGYLWGYDGETFG